MYRLIGQLRRGRAISKGISTYLSLPTQERGWNNIANVAGIDSLFCRLHDRSVLKRSSADQIDYHAVLLHGSLS